MKHFRLMAILLAVTAMVFTACGGGGGSNGSTEVVFQSAVQTGGTSGSADSTGLTLTFDIDPTTLSADNITLTGATKGALTGSGTTRSLAITGLSTANGGTVTVEIASPSGYSITGSPLTAVIYRTSSPTAVTFKSAVQTGGTSGSADSTGLTLTFDIDPTTLSADNITLTGATKGALTGSGTTRSLAISELSVSNGGTVTVAISNPSGYSMSGSPKTAVVYKAPTSTIITIAAISGVTAPVSGAVPVTTITETTQYSGTVSWSGSPATFTPTTVYTATITLTPKSGYTLTGVAANFFTVTGATSVANSVNTGVITAVFPAALVKLGDAVYGGIVAYIFVSGETGYVLGQQHGLIAAESDLAGTQWAITDCQGTSVTTGTAVGTGSANTDALIALNGAGTTYAAGLARAYTGGGFTDWYLPSKDELNKLCASKILSGMEGLYWSSSQNCYYLAWCQSFSASDYGVPYGYEKNWPWGVRPVRTF